MEKLIKNGKVAVLYSPGFGAGWSTWCGSDAEKLVFDKDIAEAILSEDISLAKKIAKEKYPDVYDGGIYQLKVAWVKIGQRIDIREYDGSECIEYLDKIGYVV